MQWRGINIDKLHDLELIQAYRTCLRQEAARVEARSHEKFNKGYEHAITKRNVTPMEFPPPNPAFLQVKEALLNELTNRKLDIPKD